MALVLCTGVDTVLLETRKLILEQAGHTVVSVSDEPSLARACQKHPFDVAVVGQMVSTNMKQHIAAIIKQHCAGVKVLELYPQFSKQVLREADAALPVPVDVPRDLADCVNELAKQKQSKKAESGTSGMFS
jgi:CheY-like chemotaxis protein